MLNKADSPNLATTTLVQEVRYWRGVGDLQKPIRLASQHSTNDEPGRPRERLLAQCPRLRLGSHLINARSGDWAGTVVFKDGRPKISVNRGDRSFARPRCCSSVKARCGDWPSVTPSGQPKSLAAPSAPIYEMISRLFGRLGQARSLGGPEGLGIPLDKARLSSEFYLV